MAEENVGLQKPEFIKGYQLWTATYGLILKVKGVDSKVVFQKGQNDGPQSRHMGIAECLVGDETAMIVFTARGDQAKFF